MMSVTETSECAEASNEIPPLCQDGPFRVLECSGTALRIRWQGAPIAQERDYKGVWRECWPAEKLIYPVLGADAKANLSEAARTRYAAHEDFRRSVPERFASRVECFPSFQWNLLLLMNAVAKGDELAQSNLVLAYALANNHELRLKPDQTALPLALFHCQDKQRDILNWLGFPRSEALVRVFRKIDPAAASPGGLRQLRNTVTTYPGVIRTLSHLPRINRQVFDMFRGGSFFTLVTPNLLDELSDSASDILGSLIDRLAHALVLQREMGVPVRKTPFKSIQTVDSFIERIDRDYIAHEQHCQQLETDRRARLTAERRRALEAQQNLDGVRLTGRSWPPPPIEGTPFIFPIDSLAGLLREAKQQKNCVASYWREVVKGEVYIYSVKLPRERATLSIRRVHANTWRLSELQRKANAPVSGKLRSVVDRWIYEYNLLSAAKD